MPSEHDAPRFSLEQRHQLQRHLLLLLFSKQVEHGACEEVLHSADQITQVGDLLQVKGRIGGGGRGRGGQGEDVPLDEFDPAG